MNRAKKTGASTHIEERYPGTKKHEA